MSSTQTEYVQDASSTNIEADNGALVQIASSDGQQNCLTESNELFFNNSAQLSMNIEVITDTANEIYNIKETSTTNNHFTEVLQDNKLRTMENICDVNNSTPTTDNKKNLKRCHLPIDVSGIPPSKKFCFTDGLQTTHISREDFISNDAWIRFLKFTVFKNRQVEVSNKKNHRKDERIENIKELIKRDVEQVELEGCPEVLQTNGPTHTNTEENVEPPKKKRKSRRGGRNSLCFVCSKRSRVQKLRPCGHRVCMLCIPGLKKNACPACEVDIDSYLPPELMPKKSE